MPYRVIRALPSLFKGRARGDQIYDTMCIVIFLTSVAIMRNLKAGSIYYWMKDISAEVLKITALHNAVQIGDMVRVESLQPNDNAVGGLLPM